MIVKNAFKMKVYIDRVKNKYNIIENKMKIEVYVKDAVFTVNCGNGSQRLRWLAEIGALNYDKNAMKTTGEPKLLKLEDGNVLNMNDRIGEKLYDNARVWVLFEDYTISQ